MSAIVRKVVALALSYAVVGCAPAPATNKIEFTSATVGTSFAIRALTPGEKVLVDTPGLWDAGLLCLGDVAVSFHRDAFKGARQSEALLFARNPFDLADRLVALDKDQIKQGRWSEQLRAPEVLPRAVGVVFPPNPQHDPALALRVPLGTGMFFGGPPAALLLGNEVMCETSADRTQRVPMGSLKAALVYQRGLCSVETPIDDVLVEVNNSLWAEYVRDGRTTGENRDYSHAISTVFSRSNELVGGFLLAFHFNAYVVGVHGHQWGKFRYAFVLEDGLVNVEPEELELGADGGWSQDMVGSLRNTLAGTIRDRFRDKAVLKQSRDVGEPIGKDCVQASECAVVADSLADQVDAGGLSRMGIPGATADQISRAKCALGKQAECTRLGRDGAAQFSRTWICDSESHRCEVVLRAQRVNTYTDNIELVWFDEPDPDSTAFALAAANESAATQLCEARQVHAEPPVALRAGAVWVGGE